MESAKPKYMKFILVVTTLIKQNLVARK